MSERADKDLALHADVTQLQNYLNEKELKDREQRERIDALEKRLKGVELLVTEPQARVTVNDCLISNLDAEVVQRAEADTALARRLQEYQSRG